MLETTVGQLLVNDALPEELRDYNRTLDKKGVASLYHKLATQHPEKYREVAKKLSDIARHESQRFGGFSFGLAHLQKSRAAADLRNRLAARIDQLVDDDRTDDKQREDAIVRLAGEQMNVQRDKVYDESIAEKNPLALQVLSGSKGSKVNLASIRGSDMLYVDHRDRVVPVPVLRSYAEGLTPWEYWAGSYGARKGTVELKLNTAQAGYFGKVLGQASHRLVVTDLDGDGEPDTVRGLPVETDDPDNEGALLAHDIGPYKRNTVLTPKILKHLSQKGHKRILVRSPTIGGSPDGGVYARDVGVREHGVLPGRGENPGMAAAQSLSEVLTQSSISSKHTGGVAGEGKAVSGFSYIESQVQVPKHIRGGATHSEVDGVVGKIEPAPAGGSYVYVNGEQHYVSADNPLKVKTGDRVEAGDVLSDGVPNPSHVVKHKGIGEGRRYFVKAFQQAMASGGIRAHRRNVELLARGLINHVRLTDELDRYVPEDVVPYSTLEHIYNPRTGAQTLKPSMAAGKYLEKPVLHYTIGTPLRPSVIRDLDEFGVKDVTVHNDPPPFQAEMIRGMDTLANDPDWMTRFYGSGLKKSLLRGVQRGAVSDEQGTSFVPSLARSVDFGRSGAVHKPEPGWKVLP